MTHGIRGKRRSYARPVLANPINTGTLWPADAALTAEDARYLRQEENRAERVALIATVPHSITNRTPRHLANDSKEFAA